MTLGTIAAGGIMAGSAGISGGAGKAPEAGDGIAGMPVAGCAANAVDGTDTATPTAPGAVAGDRRALGVGGIVD